MYLDASNFCNGFLTSKMCKIYFLNTLSKTTAFLSPMSFFLLYGAIALYPSNTISFASPLIFSFPLSLVPFISYSPRSSLISNARCPLPFLFFLSPYASKHVYRHKAFRPRFLLGRQSFEMQPLSVAVNQLSGRRQYPRHSPVLDDVGDSHVSLPLPSLILISQT